MKRLRSSGGAGDCFVGSIVSVSGNAMALRQSLVSRHGFSRAGRRSIEMRALAPTLLTTFPSGAKALAPSNRVTARLKSCPDTNQVLRADRVQPYHNVETINLPHCRAVKIYGCHTVGVI